MQKSCTSCVKECLLAFDEFLHFFKLNQKLSRTSWKILPQLSVKQIFCTIFWQFFFGFKKARALSRFNFFSKTSKYFQSKFFENKFPFNFEEKVFKKTKISGIPLLVFYFNFCFIFDSFIHYFVKRILYQNFISIYHL